MLKSKSSKKRVPVMVDKGKKQEKILIFVSFVVGGLLLLSIIGKLFH
jgi:hypothetical protein